MTGGIWAMWVAVTATCLGCGTVRPMVAGPYARLDAPVLPEANVHGPIVERVRVTGFSNFSYGSTSAAAAATQSASAAATSSVAVRAASVSYEHFASNDVEQFMIKLLEDTGTITTIRSDAPIELKGVGGQAESAAGWKGIWNFIAVFSLTAYIGMPMYWEAASTVELRMYENHEFIRSYVGDGRCYAFGTLYYFAYNSITFLGNAGGGSLGACASATAVGNAVLKLQEAATRLRAEESRTLDHP